MLLVEDCMPLACTRTLPTIGQTTIPDFTRKVVRQLLASPSPALPIKMPNPFFGRHHQLLLRIIIPVHRVKIMGLMEKVADHFDWPILRRMIGATVGQHH